MSKSDHVPQIDALRGIAALVVAFVFHQHYLSGDQNNGPLNGLPVFTWLHHYGWTMVDLFFVISGYLITAILDHTRGSDAPFRTFYIRRILRIVPLYYAFVFLVPIVFAKLGSQWVGTPATRFWDWTFMTNVIMTHQTPREIGMIFSSFWSLAIEEQFYLLWPLVILLVPERKLVPVCASLIAFSFFSRVALTMSGYAAYGWLLMPARFDGLAAGALVALLQKRNPALLDTWAPRLVKASAVVVPAFVISELKTGFQMGFFLFVPFLLIDLVVSTTLLSMGMLQLPPAMVSLPFKVLLFVMIDGWNLLVGSIVRSFA